MGESFAWVIPLTQAGCGVLFLAARRAGAAPEAGRWSAAFLLTAAAFAVPALEGVLPIRVVAAAADALFALAFYHYAGALLLRYGGPPARRARLTLLGFGVAAPVAAVAAGNLPAELMASDIACAAQIALALLLVPRWPAAWIDRGLVTLSWLNVADNLLRTVSLPFTLADATFESFLETPYAVLMQATALVVGFAFALLALVAVMADVIAGYRRDALLDPLTGLYNRRGLEGFAAADRTGRPWSLVACDLDHFKRVNDTWGHAAGDRVLVAVAALIRRELPRNAAAARVGGEEFVLFLPAHSPAEAHRTAARLQAAMRAHDWAATGIEVRQSASFGLATRDEAGDGTLADAIRRADARLYEAKRAGRDQIRGFAVA